jgi:hypothetical protein
MTKTGEHLKEAERFEENAETLAKESMHRNYQSIIVLCWHSACHYVAAFYHEKGDPKEHNHSRLMGMLKKDGFDEAFTHFNRIDVMRSTRSYQGEKDGDSAQKALGYLAKLRKALGKSR